MDRLEDVFDFNKRERGGIILLSLLSLLLFFLKTQMHLFPLQKTLQQNLIANIQFEEEGEFYSASDSSRVYDFDPNVVKEEDLKNFGLDNYAIKSWLGFLSKGYRFRKVVDVKKIYGLKEQDYLRLLPYIKIRNVKKQKSKKQKKYDKKFSPKKNRIQQLDINSASKEDFMRLKGIGQKRAATILNFRKAVGGFYSIEQIKNVYGIDSILFESIKSHLVVEDATFKRWNIFNLSADSLAKHRFINRRAAYAIKRYIRNNPEKEKIDPAVIKSLDGVDSIYIDNALPYLVLRKY